MIAVARLIDRFTSLLAQTLAWLIGAMALLVFIVVVLRYAFDQGAIVLQEAALYLHGLIFMLGIPYALKENAHVRVDLIYSRLSRKARARIDLVGHGLFLIPVASFIFFTSLPYVAASWRILEKSSEVGGLPAVFALKTLIPLMAALLFLQGASEIIKQLVQVRTMSGAGDPPKDA